MRIVESNTNLIDNLVCYNHQFRTQTSFKLDFMICTGSLKKVALVFECNSLGFNKDNYILFTPKNR